MSDPYVAEIRIFSFNFAPVGWAFCDGQLMPISQNTALFSLLGTMYGGDGKSTFALPDLRGAAAMNAGQGAGLSQYSVGEMGGSPTVTLLESEFPNHPHTLRADTFDPGDVAVPSQNSSFAVSAGGAFYQSSSSAGVMLNPLSLTPSPPEGGGNQPHNNMQPYVTLNYCISLRGVFPPRS